MLDSRDIVFVNNFIVWVVNEDTIIYIFNLERR